MPKVPAASLRPGFTALELTVSVAIFGVLTGLLLVAVQSARATAARATCANNLRQLGLALHGLHDCRSVLPPGTAHPMQMDKVYGPSRHPFPLLNWGARLLPHLEHQTLWYSIVEVYRTDPDVSGPGLNALSLSPVMLFRCPADAPASINPPLPHLAETSNYLGVAGRSSTRTDGVLHLDSVVRLTDITDGTSNTLLVGERPINEFVRGGRWSGGWGHWGTGDSYLGTRETNVPDRCPDYPYPFSRGAKANPCSFYHFWSFHSGGANFLFADGSVRFLPYSANGLLPALATRDGGEAIAY